MFGTLIFVFPEEQNDIKELMNEYIDLEDHNDYIVDNSSSVEGPYLFNLTNNCVIYKLRFKDDQWINVLDLQEHLAPFENFNDEGYDIIHAVSDNSFVDVVSLSGYHDTFSEDPMEMQSLFETFGFDVHGDVVDEDLDDVEDTEDEEDYEIFE